MPAARRAPGPASPSRVKDLFDEHGHPTPAGSAVLRDAPAAAEDAPVVARLKRQGFIVIGRTNMVEFAFSGLGVNPHYGTPRSPWDRKTGRLPGGSSSGAAVAAADHMGFGGLGTDTGGSCRVPAALCGVVGYKPTARRVPHHGRAAAVALARQRRAAGPQRRLLRPAGCDHQRRGAAAAAAAAQRRRAAARPAARHLPDR